MQSLLRRSFSVLPRCARSMASGTGGVHLRVSPDRCLFDEPLRLQVSGLIPEQEVTLRTELTDEAGELFLSLARYRAGSGGELDISRSPALEGGSFTGVEAEGPLWALQPQSGGRRLLKKDVGSPLRLRFSLYRTEPPGDVLARATQDRRFLGERVSRLPVREGNVRAALFLPPGPGPFPGVIEIQGTGGGLLEYKASLLASRGFATMALAYYNYEDLPKQMKAFRLEYFEEAVNYMLQHPQVKGPGIGLLGHSKGGDLVMSMASFLKGDGSFPAVIDMFGDEGGLVEYRSSLLASHGFAALALPYVAFEDLPPAMTEFHLEYFEEAAKFLSKHPKVQGPGVGVIGTGKGADLALSMITFLPQVVAAVSISGCCANTAASLSYKDFTIPGLTYNMSRVQVSDTAMFDVSEALDDPLDPANSQCLIPLEKANGAFMFIVGENDLNWKSSVYAQAAIERLKQHGKNDFTLLTYPGAGHRIDPPCSPFCPAAVDRVLGVPVLGGGELKAHCQAQEDSWQKIQDFLNFLLR